MTLLICAGVRSCTVTFPPGYNSVDNHLKDLEKEERETVRKEEEKREERESLGVCVEIDLRAKESFAVDVEV